MLTPDQEKWIAHLSNTDTIAVVSFDPTCNEKFERVKQKLQSRLGNEAGIEHHGASSLGISGQDEIDVYIPVKPEKFDKYVNLVQGLLSKPRSLYPLERARFVTDIEGKHIDVFVINKECEGWKNSLKFKKYLLTHPKALNNYKKLKEEASGQSVREYYRRKIKFINEIIAKST